MAQIPEFSLPDFSLPRLPEGWSYFATLQDGFFIAIILLLISLLIIWWRQQSRNWFRVVISALLAALLLCIGSFYIFVVVPYEVGCFGMCTGWRGFPRPIALITLDERSWVGPVDFGANLALLWLILLTTMMLWRILVIGIDWDRRSLRTKFLVVLFFWLIPWALLPRFLSPPQPTVSGEDLRVANNALRAAEFTYNITGPWVQRLALEDIRTSEGVNQLIDTGTGQISANSILTSTISTTSISITSILTSTISTSSILTSTISNANNTSGLDENGITRDIAPLSSKQVCLRGYTFFYLPWRRYRLILEASGVSSVQMIQMPLLGSCWE